MRRVNLRWWASFALFAALGLGWVVATPIFAAPDEVVHVIRAASVGHGELLGKKPPPERLIPPIGEAALEVTAPAIYKDVNVGCFAFKWNRTADCLDVGGPVTEVKMDTWVGHHPPAYYAMVGFLSRIVRPGSGQVLLMRAIGMLVIAALLASCLETLKRVAIPIWSSIGFAIAISPMVLFLASTVSPSGVEIGGAMGVWVHGAVLAQESGDRVDPKLVDRLGIALVVLVLARALSPLWIAVIGLVLLILTTRAGLRALARPPRVWAWGGALVAGAAIWAWWYAYGHPLAHFVGTPVKASVPSLVRTSFGKTDEMLREMVGVFGWLDTPAPRVTYFLWLVALAAIAALALALSSKRFVWALLAATAATIVLPVVVESAGAHKAGFIWQGRYTLPLAVGVPVIAGIGIGSSERARRIAARFAPRFGWAVVAALALAHILAFAQMLRRYSVGVDGPLWFFPDARWEPPVPSLVLVIAYSLLIAGTLWWVVLAPAAVLRRRDRAGAGTSGAGADAAGTVGPGEAPVTA